MGLGMADYRDEARDDWVRAKRQDAEGVMDRDPSDRMARYYQILIERALHR